MGVKNSWQGTGTFSVAKRVHRNSVAPVVLWYHREAKEKKQKLPVHTQYRKGSLGIIRGSFLLRNVGIWYIMGIYYCVWRKK